jgi:type IV pilus assembly protein PilY1
VTDPASPSILWRVDNNTPGFSELGQTWAEPKVAKIAGYANRVLIVSAGYDAAANDVSPQGTATMGRGVYIIDAITGAPIWYAGPAAVTGGGVTAKLVAGMTYAIPADATAIDSDNEGGGLVDRIYLADTGGNIWRANISAVSGGTPDFANWTVTKIASLGGSGANARKFLNKPDVVAFDPPTVTKDSILVGSGDREAPFDVAVTNRFYMIKDDHGLTATPSTAFEADLCDLTGDALQGADATAKAAAAACLADTTKRGWLISFEAGKGEKVVTNSVTVNNTTVFGTNVPEASLDHTAVCSAGLGEARLYAINFKNATAVIDQQPDGLMGPNDLFAVNRGGGFPAPPTAITTVINGKMYEGIGSGSTIVPPPGVTIGRRTRVWWNIRNESN